jgi:cation transport protein ChaC
VILNRESIKRGIIREMIDQNEVLGPTNRLTDAERNESLRAALKGAKSGDPVWVFGYGSLMWNPAFHFTERRCGLVHGYHRRYCMWIMAGRGTPDVPGLMLALDRGGSCRGIAFRIAPEQVEEELDILWSREMGGGSYRWRWVTVRTEAGAVRALTFVINRDHVRYARNIPRRVLVAHLANAQGWLGSCAEYLANTVAHMHELGIDDGPMHAMLNRVRAHRGGAPRGQWEDGRWRTAMTQVEKS